MVFSQLLGFFSFLSLISRPQHNSKIVQSRFDILHELLAEADIQKLISMVKKAVEFKAYFLGEYSFRDLNSFDLMFFEPSVS